MLISNSVTQSNGVISVVLTASFVGDSTDPTDKQKIAAFGDPKINLAGRLLADPNNPSFTFGFQSDTVPAGLTTEMQNYRARFLTGLPPRVPPPPGQPVNPSWMEVHREERQGVPVLGPLNCVVANDAAQNEAAVAWVAIVVSRIVAGMAILRANIILPVIAPTTV